MAQNEKPKSAIDVSRINQIKETNERTQGLKFLFIPAHSREECHRIDSATSVEERRMRHVRFVLVEFCMWFFFVFCFSLFAQGFGERRRKSRVNVPIFLGTLFTADSAGRRAMPAGIPTMQHQSPLTKILLQGLTQCFASMRSLLSHIGVAQGRREVSSAILIHFTMLLDVTC